MKTDIRTAITQASSAPRAEIEQRILDAVAAVAYGSVEIVIHDGRVVQIERREKIRVDGHRGQG